jgi:phosphoglycerate kinase
VELLENLRFDPGEEGDDPAFVARLVDGVDAYVDDAFGACHRAHASIVGPPRTLPSAAGRLLAREVEVLGGLRDAPARPFVAILGGAKVSDKLGVIEALLDVADTIIVGGGMCFTFLAAQGDPTGASLLEPDQVATCRALLDAHGARIVLPHDITALGPGGRIGDPAAVARSARCGPTCPTAGWASTSARHRRRLHRRDRGGPDRAVERPDGGLRGPPLRRRHPGGRRGGRRRPRLHRGRRRRLGRRGRPARPGRRHRPRLHRVGGASLELLEQGDLPGLEALRETHPTPATST